MKEQTFEEYLYSNRYTKNTVNIYVYTVNIFLNENPEAAIYKYKDVLRYMSEIVKRYKQSDTKSRVLSSIKKYYDYLLEIGKRKDHPCRTLIVKCRRNKEVIHEDLFTSSELELLLEREEYNETYKLKNQAIMSLLIFQGLTAAEIANMKVSHIDLDAGTIFVKESRTITQRHLDIHPRQYRILDRYLHEVRPVLMTQPSDMLCITQRGTPITMEGIKYLVETFKPLFPDRNLNTKTIRYSVIANWMNEKGMPLEQVQLMAGHKWISTTAKYRFTPIHEQRELINRFHPLG
ncbi:MAG TPA: tyrosine-type recombinase/integrase [Cytophagaceae bacterium]|jgi:integrase/recombinase XerD|nr:tyrosine-type recombinase/integrase [Cytophagaceae bacterium]